MLDPIEREKIEAAIKAALADAKLSCAEAGRRLGKGASWVGSVLQRVRDGHSLTTDTVRTLRVEVPTLEEHLKSAGWTTFGSVRNRPVLPTRSTEHLRKYRAQLMLQRDDLDKKIREVTGQIAELEEMVVNG